LAAAPSSCQCRGNLHSVSLSPGLAVNDGEEEEEKEVINCLDQGHSEEARRGKGKHLRKVRSRVVEFSQESS